MVGGSNGSKVVVVVVVMVVEVAKEKIKVVVVVAVVVVEVVVVVAMVLVATVERCHALYMTRPRDATPSGCHALPIQYY